jgi:hypothetical protein
VVKSRPVSLHSTQKYPASGYFLSLDPIILLSTSISAVPIRERIKSGNAMKFVGQTFSYAERQRAYSQDGMFLSAPWRSH